MQLKDPPAMPNRGDRIKNKFNRTEKGAIRIQLTSEEYVQHMSRGVRVNSVKAFFCV